MKTWASRLTVLASLATISMVLLALPMWMFGVPRMLESRARALAPPIYPGAVRIKTTLNSAAGEATEITDFRIDDDVRVVRRWLEARDQRFNFTTCAITHHLDCVIGERCDNSLMARLATQSMQLGELDQRGRTCASVVLEADPSAPHRMFLHVNIGWPTNG